MVPTSAKNWWLSGTDWTSFKSGSETHGCYRRLLFKFPLRRFSFQQNIVVNNCGLWFVLIHFDAETEKAEPSKSVPNGYWVAFLYGEFTMFYLEHFRNRSRNEQFWASRALSLADDPESHYGHTSCVRPYKGKTLNEGLWGAECSEWVCWRVALS